MIYPEIRWTEMLHGSPLTAAREEGAGVRRFQGEGVSGTGPLDVLDGYRRENCLLCKRLLIYPTPTRSMVYADGFTDGPSLCHACKCTTAQKGAI